MRSSLLAAVALVACAPAEPAAPPSWDRATPLEHDLPRPMLPPPGDLALVSSSPVAGAPAILRATGAPVGATIGFAISTVGPGPGPCPAALGGACVDLLDPSLLGTAPVLDLGAAELTSLVPAGAEGASVWLQALSAGAPADSSNIVQVTVAAAGSPDADGDGDPDATDCNDADSAIHHGAVEACDGVDQDCSAVTDEAGLATILGSDTYASLHGAVAAAAPGATVRVCDGVVTGRVLVERDLSLVSLNGPAATTLDGAAAGPALAIFSGSVSVSGFTVRNGSGDTYLDSYGVPYTFGGGIDIGGSASVTLTDLIVEQNTASVGGGIGASHTATVTVSQSTIRNNTGGSGGGLALGGVATLSSLLVTQNAASVQGGGVYSWGPLSLSDSVVTFNTGDYGGGVMAIDGSAFPAPTHAIANTTVSDNSAGTTSGGGLYLRGLDVQLIDLTVERNTASWGGGAYIEEFAGTATVVRSSFTDNTATLYGGGLNLRVDGALTDSTLSGNQAAYGGGLVIASVAVDATGTVIEANTADDGAGGGEGGGVYLWGEPSDPVTLTGGVVRSNSAARRGGGIRSIQNGPETPGGPVFTGSVLDGVVVQDNDAVYGGGLRVSGGLQLLGGAVRGNVATASGGGFYADANGGLDCASGFLSLVGTDVVDNTASSVGGAVYVEDNTVFAHAAGAALASWGTPGVDDNAPDDVYVSGVGTLNLLGLLDDADPTHISEFACSVWTGTCQQYVNTDPTAALDQDLDGVTTLVPDADDQDLCVW